jgi:soluble lytic murein transglycosylase-like protein
MAVAVLAAAVWLVAARPASAQIASYVDEQGKLVFVNAEPPQQLRTIRRVRQSGGFSADDGAAPAILPDKLNRLVQKAAERHRLDPALVRAIVQAESGGNPRAISSKGAFGLMQLIPATAQRYGVSNVFDPAQNLDGGARYLRDLLDRFNGDVVKSLAAYNAGEGAVERFGGVPNYPETRHYVQRITNSYFRPGSGSLPGFWQPASRPIQRTVDERGRVVFTNE